MWWLEADLRKIARRASVLLYFRHALVQPSRCTKNRVLCIKLGFVLHLPLQPTLIFPLKVASERKFKDFSLCYRTITPIKSRLYHTDTWLLPGFYPTTIWLYPIFTQLLPGPNCRWRCSAVRPLLPSKSRTWSDNISPHIAWNMRRYEPEKGLYPRSFAICTRFPFSPSPFPPHSLILSRFPFCSRICSSNFAWRIGLRALSKFTRIASHFSFLADHPIARLSNVGRSTYPFSSSCLKRPSERLIARFPLSYMHMLET